jgi:hypothetical protein
MRVREGVPVVRNRVGKGIATARMQGARHREPPREIYFSRMLKKSLFSPAQPRRAETRLVPCSVLASFRPSTGTRPPHHSAARTDLVLLICRTVRPKGMPQAFTCYGLLNSLFEHPTGEGGEGSRWSCAGNGTEKREVELAPSYYGERINLE